MNRILVLLCALVGGSLAPAPPATAADEPITLRSLLEEMINRDALARWPQPAYLCKQFSSYDRGSKTPKDAEGWFANADQGNFLRTEQNGGREKWVLMDHSGPGCIGRIWSPDRRANGGQEDATVRFYFDGAAEPALEAPWLDFLSGKAFVKPPLAHVSQRAGVLFLPIPFARGCKITLDRKPFYYIITYRAYEAGTKVETFSMAAFEAAAATVEAVGRALAEAKDPAGPAAATLEKTVAAGAEETVALPAGPAAVRSITLMLDPRDEQALRSTVLKIRFDGQETVWCPVGDFFGSGVGYNPFKGWYRTVADDGTMTCRWVMPYEKSAALMVANLGGRPVAVRAAVTTGPWTWDERSMVFHGNWRHQYPLPTQPRTDWNYIQAAGQGVYVGDTLTVMNPVAKWWGEGDEKIWVDGESFPSHFGTGTEDYYGYAWGGRSTGFYTHPFHAQVRAVQPMAYGYNVETRTRAIDAIPFTKNLKLDMEVWHWANCDVAYAVATYWYGRPGVTCNRGPEPKEAARPVPQPPKLEPAKPAAKPAGKPAAKPAAKASAIPGAVECEKMEVVAKSPGVEAAAQDVAVHGKGRWSGDAHLFVRAKKIGDFVEVRFPAEGAGPRKLTLYATKSYDYGVLRFTVNGKPAGPDVDTYAEKPGPMAPIELGTFEPVDGALRLRTEVVGKNAASQRTGTYFGLDCVTVTPAK